MDLMKKERKRRLEWPNSRLYPPIKVGPLERTSHFITLYHLLQSIWLIVSLWRPETFEMKVKLLETVMGNVLKMDFIKKERIRRLEWLNFRMYPPIKVRLLEKTIYLITIYFVLQSIWLIVNFWSSATFEIKIKLLETIIVSMFYFGMYTDLFFNMSSASAVQQAMGMDYYIRYPDDGKHDVEKKVQYIKNQEESACKKVNFIRNLVIVAGIANFILPILINLIEHITMDKPFEELAYTNLVYNPFIGYYQPCDTSSYIFTELAQIGSFCAAMVGANMVFANYKFSVRSLTDEIGLFIMSLSKLDELCTKRRLLEFPSRKNNQMSELHEEYKCDAITNENSMRRTIRTLCIHHQILFKKKALLNIAYQLRMIYTNAYICLQLTLSVFYFQRGDLMIKLRFGIYSITLLGFVFTTLDEGQGITDKIEEMCQAVHECSWYDVPQSLKKLILLIMIRNTNIKPMRVFNMIRLDRPHFVLMLQATYSYFNLLQTFN